MEKVGRKKGGQRAFIKPISHAVLISERCGIEHACRIKTTCHSTAEFQKWEKLREMIKILRKNEWGYLR